MFLSKFIFLKCQLKSTIKIHNLEFIKFDLTSLFTKTETWKMFLFFKFVFAYFLPVKKHFTSYLICDVFSKSINFLGVNICENILFRHLLISFNNKKIKFSLSSFWLSFKTISYLASVNFQVCIEVNYGQLGIFD